MERAGCFVVCSKYGSCCRIVVSVLCFFLGFYGLVCELISLWKELVALLCVQNTVIVVELLSVFCVSSWMFYGLVRAHFSLWKVMVALFCVLNCVLAVVLLSVFWVSSWCFYELVCVHISLWKELVVLF